MKPEHVLLVGVDGVLPHEQRTIEQLGIQVIPSKSVISSSHAITQWIQQNKFKHVAIHLDLDVLDPALFRSLLFCNPDVDQPIEAERGKTKIQHITRALKDIANTTDVVGMSFSEYMPWDALNLKKMLNDLPFMR